MSDTLAEVLGRLEALEHGRQALVDTLWSQIPAQIQESAYGAAVGLVGGVATLVVPPQTTLLVKITHLVATIPSGATGLIQLGDVTIPIDAGLSNITGGFLLSQRATRALVSNTAGPMALVLMGESLPSWGQLT